MAGATDPAPLGPLLIELAPRVNHLVRHALRKVDPPLSYAQYRVLRQVSRGQTTLSALRSPATLALSTLSEIVDALVKRDLLTRAPSVQDRRAVDLSLTPSGEEALAGAQARLDEFTARLTAAVSPAARAWLAETLEPINEAAKQALVDEHGKAAKPDE